MATPRKRIMIKIGIVDDHAIVRSGLRQFLSEHVDLRVEDHPEPIQELNRLLELHKKFYAGAHKNKPKFNRKRFIGKKTFA